MRKRMRDAWKQDVMSPTPGLGLAPLLIGCQPSMPAGTAESLAADPERLKDVQRQCWLDHASVGKEVCNAASEAYRRRFMRGGRDDARADGQ